MSRDMCYKCKSTGHQVPVDYCHHCIRRNPSCFCEHGVFLFKGNQLDVCAECEADAEVAALEAKAAVPGPGHEWDRDEESPHLFANLEDEELEAEDQADLAEGDEGEDGTQESGFVVHEGEEGLPEGLARQLGRGYEPEEEEDLVFEDQGEDEPMPEAKGPESKAAALEEVLRFWGSERFAPERVAAIVAQYRLIEGLGTDLFSDDDVAFMLDALCLGERDEDQVYEMAQAIDDASLRAAFKKRKFRFQGKVAMLTYNATGPITLDEMVELVRKHEWHGEDKSYTPVKFSVGLERAPTTGQVHFHVFIDFLTKMNILGKKRFLLPGFPGGHPDIRTVTKGQYRDKLEYTMKGGEYQFSNVKEAWLPNNSRGFKTAKENHELWKQQLHQAKQRSPFPLTLLGPESKILREPKPQDKKRHWVIKSAPDAGKSWWAHTAAAGAAVFFPRKGNKYPLEGI